MRMMAVYSIECIEVNFQCQAEQFALAMLMADLIYVLVI